MRGCNSRPKQIIACAVCFGAGILLSFFLPPVVMVFAEAAVICIIGILCML